MAGADPFKTGNTAFRLGLAKALVPFVFVYQPAMLIVTKGFTWPAFIQVIAFCVAAIVFLAAGLTGYMRSNMPPWQRALSISGAILMMAPGWVPRLLGIACVVPVLLFQLTGWRRRTDGTTPA
jgi:TRAP-type uncharacterized transport system fused permease subunit